MKRISYGGYKINVQRHRFRWPHDRHIVTNTLPPPLSREYLTRSLAKEQLRKARVRIDNGDFVYGWS